MITFVLSLAHVRKCSDMHCDLMILVIIHWLESSILRPPYIVSEHSLCTLSLVRPGLSVFPTLQWEYIFSQEWGTRDFPGGPVVKNPPVNAGDTDSTPGLGRPHIRRTATKPSSWNYWAHALGQCSLVREAPLPCNEKPTYGNYRVTPAGATRESSGTATKTQRSQK